MNPTYKTTPEQRKILVRLIRSGMPLHRVADYARTFFGIEYTHSAAYHLKAVRGIKIRPAIYYDLEYIAYVVEMAKTHKPANLFALVSILSPDKRGRVPNYKSVRGWLSSAGITLPKQNTQGKHDARKLAVKLARSGYPTGDIVREILERLAERVSYESVNRWRRAAGLPVSYRRSTNPAALPCQDNMLTRDWDAAEARSIRAGGPARWWESDEAGRPIRRRRAA